MERCSFFYRKKNQGTIRRLNVFPDFWRTLIKIYIFILFLGCFQWEQITFQSIILDFCVKFIDVVAKTQKKNL